MVAMVDSKNTLKSVIETYPNSVLVINEDTTQVIKKDGLLSLLEKSPNYFILLDRDLKTKLQLNVAAILESNVDTIKCEKIARFIT